MPDLGHELIFGANLNPGAEGHDQTVELAIMAEDSGLEIVGFQDHPYQASFLDTWTLLSFVAAATQRIRLLPNVINLPLRPPAVLARSAASLDILSRGRLILGLGAGAFEDAIVGMGGPPRSPGENVDALAEGIHVIRQLMSPGPPVTFDGRYYQLNGARPGPAAPHPVEIWLGAYKPRMLALTGMKADGWIPSLGYADPNDLARLGAEIDAAALGAGRDPALIRRAYNIAGTFGPARGFLAGPPELWAEQLTQLVLSAGISVFLLSPGAAPELDLQRYAAEVAPAVREAVEKERRRPAPTSPAPVAIRSDARDQVGAEGSIGRASQQTLLAVHNHLRGELSRLSGVVDEVAAGRETPQGARSYLNQMTMRQNYWTLGAFCATYCRVVSIHHAIEDQRLFMDLEVADGSLADVLERLRGEHEAIATVLAEIDAALVAMIADESQLQSAQSALQRLQGTLLAHLNYEEDQLLEPIGRLGIEV